mgnify:CR=1 FL=1
MNTTIITGFVGKDPVYKQVGANKTELAEFSVATTKKRGEEQVVTWFTCEAWANQAGICKVVELAKGNPVTIQGEVSANAYVDKEGNPRAELKLNVTQLVTHAKRESSE